MFSISRTLHFYGDGTIAEINDILLRDMFLIRKRVIFGYPQGIIVLNLKDLFNQLMYQL